MRFRVNDKVLVGVVMVVVLGVVAMLPSIVGGVIPELSGASYIANVYWWCVGAGLVDDMEAVRLRAVNSATSSTYSCIWSVDEAYNRLSAAANVKVASTSANDTLLGSGAQKVVLEGLDSGYREQSEEIKLNGQTAVTSVKKYLRVNGVRVSQGAINAGDIYVFTGNSSAGVPASVTAIYAKVDTGASETRQGFYTVPEGKTAFLRKVIFHRPGVTTASEYVTYRIRHTEDELSATGYYFVDGEFTLYAGDPNQEFEFTFPVKVMEHNDLWFEAKTSSALTKSEINAEILLWEN